MFDQTVLKPDELALLQRVFNEIVLQPPFARSYDNERDFALVILRAYQLGNTGEVELTAHCRKIAADRFQVGEAD